MAVVVARSGVPGSRFPLLKPAAVLVASAGFAGALQAAVLHWLAGAASAREHPLAAALAVAAVVGVGIAKGRPPWQVDRETPRRWLDHESLLTPALNGAVLGSGVLTRIGFWTFYVQLAAAALAPRPWQAALVGAAYAVCRTGLPLVLAPRTATVGVGTSALLLRKGSAVRVDRAAAAASACLLVVAAA